MQQSCMSASTDSCQLAWDQHSILLTASLIVKTPIIIQISIISFTIASFLSQVLVTCKEDDTINQLGYQSGTMMQDWRQPWDTWDVLHRCHEGSKTHHPKGSCIRQMFIPTQAGTLSGLLGRPDLCQASAYCANRQGFRQGYNRAVTASVTAQYKGAHARRATTQKPSDSIYTMFQVSSLAW